MAERNDSKEDITGMRVIDTPEMCLDCFCSDWGVANMTPEGRYNKCDKCHYWDAERQELVRFQDA